MFTAWCLTLNCPDPSPKMADIVSGHLGYFPGTTPHNASWEIQTKLLPHALLEPSRTSQNLPEAPPTMQYWNLLESSREIQINCLLPKMHHGRFKMAAIWWPVCVLTKTKWLPSGGHSVHYENKMAAILCGRM